ncbi:Glyoxalase/bleomycin resistance protein [Nostocoides australiense Ben110]|uniref:Glyoxalase/bleomycin resistance protein n=1 Tax=Nostocoides australiense Ben110 TaxID=1193182 RepID=W6K0Y5_9MICO|nr:Glyoxalase/bleomycin resistance protein [Tetrasphaera australiensis Ben110]
MTTQTALVSDEPDFKVGLRVDNVPEAADFYAGLGFERVAEIPGPDGRTVMAIMRRGCLQLLVDALVGMPFPDSTRERMTVAGPRGLGMVIGITVDDVDAAVDYVVGVGCELSAAAQDSTWGERYAECIDPYGYAWKFSCPTPGAVGDGLDATREQWFATNR